MLNTSKIAGFVATTDPVAARDFYQRVLGLTLLSDDPFAAVFDANGTMIRVTKVQEFTPQTFTVLGWEVDDINAMVTELTGRGVSFMQVPGLPQDELGIWTTPDDSRVAWFKDPDGNTLSLSQHS